MSKEFLTIRCSEDILKAIQERMSATGKGKTEIVEALLRQALGLAESAIDESLNGQSLDERVTAIIDERTEFITRQANELVERCNESVQQLVQQLEERIEALEKLEA